MKDCTIRFVVHIAPSNKKFPFARSSSAGSLRVCVIWVLDFERARQYTRTNPARTCAPNEMKQTTTKKIYIYMRWYEAAERMTNIKSENWKWEECRLAIRQIMTQIADCVCVREQKQTQMSFSCEKAHYYVSPASEHSHAMSLFNGNHKKRRRRKTKKIEIKLMITCRLILVPISLLPRWHCQYVKPWLTVRCSFLDSTKTFQWNKYSFEMAQKFIKIRAKACECTSHKTIADSPNHSSPSLFNSPTPNNY